MGNVWNGKVKLAIVEIVFFETKTTLFGAYCHEPLSWVFGSIWHEAPLGIDVETSIKYQLVTKQKIPNSMYVLCSTNSYESYMK